MRIKRRSATVRAAMASTTTTARGTMTGSCRPRMESFRLFPSLSTVSCSREMEGVARPEQKWKN